MRFLSLFKTKKTENKKTLPPEIRRVFEIMKQVKDPESDMTVVDEGLLYGVTVEGEKVMIWFEFVSSTPSCHFCQPIALSIQRRIVRDTISILKKEGFKEIEIYNEYGFLLEKVKTAVTEFPQWCF